jgi:hypothetical protein
LKTFEGAVTHGRTDCGGVVTMSPGGTLTIWTGTEKLVCRWSKGVSLRATK